MSPMPMALWLLAQETRALLTRLDRIKPFVLHETMVPAAAPSPDVQMAIERFLVHGRKELRRQVAQYLSWLHGEQGRRVPVSEAQRRFVFLRMRFNDIVSQFDMFADVITQRSEHETGVWLAGLDELAKDALILPGNFLKAPPLICYIDRGHGAAIRRARTRLPGGGENPVAVVRIPRERMVSNGIASSLVHEVGHQGSALLNLVESFKPTMSRMQQTDSSHALMWTFWNRWISEILSDFWSVAKVGIASTLGLMGVVSLPSAFVFRVGLDDPHPIPWIRVKLSCAMGNALYPHPQWGRVASVWESYYPLTSLDSSRRQLLSGLEAGIPDFVSLLVSHRPAALRGKTLGEVVAAPDRQPERLRAAYQVWRNNPNYLSKIAPSLVCAILGQARIDGRLSPEAESRNLIRLLTEWSLRTTLGLPAVSGPKNDIKTQLIAPETTGRFLRALTTV